MNYPLFLFFGLAPSIIWLLFYLKKDKHPEPNRVVLKVFVLGMLATFPAIFIELQFRELLEQFSLSPTTVLFLYMFFGVALVEELLKFAVVRFSVFSHAVVDEPIDLILYMIVAALGFAALENIFLMLGLGSTAPFSNIAALSSLRLLGATFLHALVSGFVGYTLVFLYYNQAMGKVYLFFGLGIATLLHGLFNFSILYTTGSTKLIIPAIILFSLALFMSFAFQKVKNMKSVSKII
jgi:protease PrsW